MSDEPVEYKWIDGVERLEKYEPGGYHPAMINDLLHNRYRILDKLGYGGYSTIWLTRDEQLNRYVAIKITIAESSQPRRESSILRALSDPSSSANDARDDVPVILDEFEIQGPNGIHRCYVFAPTQGNLKEASFSRLFPIQVARALAAKLVIAVSFVHSRGFVHGDIHLRNVMVKLPSTFAELTMDQFREEYGEPELVPIERVDERPLPSNVPSHAVVPLYLGKEAPDFTVQDAQDLILSDFGEAFAPATEQRLGKECNTPLPRRAPETFFEPNLPLSYPSDIWSLGTTIWEILGMKYIFSESEPRDEVVAEQIDVLGYQDFPANWRTLWEQPKTESDEEEEAFPCRPTRNREAWPPLEEAFEEFVQKYRRKREVAGVFGEEETRAILELMRAMLKFRPEERMTIEEVLRSEWIAKWALPALKND